MNAQDITLMNFAVRDVRVERHRQTNKWGRQRHEYGDWLKILVEEVGEVAQAMQRQKGWGKETDAGDLYEELIHTAAVAVAIAEQVLEEGFESSEESR
ncbi:MazG-like family protein [Heyndrickxia faecalis]|uniref:MazG-like family protein n=1 Tax=Heyndrickxia faecalis TaxID=2824910 RepID=UPI003D2195A1